MLASRSKAGQSSEEWAVVLSNASPERAADFAKAEHERACWETAGIVPIAGIRFGLR